VESERVTVVQVYNCDGTPGEPGELPTTFPNTGVEPTTDVAPAQAMVHWRNVPFNGGPI
jgi:hypothetical protein